MKPPMVSSFIAKNIRETAKIKKKIMKPGHKKKMRGFPLKPDFKKSSTLVLLKLNFPTHNIKPLYQIYEVVDFYKSHSLLVYDKLISYFKNQEDWERFLCPSFQL